MGSHPIKVTSIKDGLGAQNQIREIREDVQSSTSCDDQTECKVLKKKDGSRSSDIVTSAICLSLKTVTCSKARTHEMSTNSMMFYLRAGPSVHFTEPDGIRHC